MPKSSKPPRQNKLESVLSGRMEAEEMTQLPPAAQTPTAPIDPDLVTSVRWADVEKCDDNRFQPRQRYESEELQELVDGLNNEGQLQPARGRPHPDKPGWIELAIGHRRKRAVKAGGNAGSQQLHPELYVGRVMVIVEDMTDEQMLDAAYHENEDRVDFNHFDRAHYFVDKQKMLSPDKEKPTPWEELEKHHELPLKARSIRRLVDLLDLPAEIQEALPQINLSDEPGRVVRTNEKHGRALLSLQPAGQKSDVPPNELQQQLLEVIANEKLSGNAAIARADMLRGVAPSGITVSHTPAGAGSSSPTGTGSSSGKKSKGGTSTSGTGSSGVSRETEDAGGDSKPDPMKQLKPAAGLLTEAARVLPGLSMSPDYRRALEAEVAQIERQLTKIRTMIREKI